MTRLAFLGTPQAALPALRLLAAEHEVAVVVTRPDRPQGRSRRLLPSAVKTAALGLGLPVVTPGSDHELRQALGDAGPLEAAVVVAYGRILRPDVLDLPQRGMLNIHFSLLPRWRGAAPVPWALLSGDPMTGATVIRLDQGVDTGPVLIAQAVDIGPEEAAGELTERLARLGAGLLLGALPRYLAGELVPVPQSDQGATYARKLEPGDRPLDVTAGREEALRRVRALSPEPGATLEVDGEPVQILRARPHLSSPPAGTWRGEEGVPVAGLADGGVELIEVRPPGRRTMSGAAWLRGRKRHRGVIG